MARKNPEMDFKNPKKCFCPPSFISRYLFPSMWKAHKNQECGKLSVKLYEHKGFKNTILFHTYWDFRIKFCFVKKRFGFYFDQSERRTEFLTREKIVSSNHKPRFKRIVFSRAFSRSSRVALSGSFDKILCFRCTRVVRNSNFQVIKS